MMSHRFWFVTFASAGILVAAACAGTPTTLWAAGAAGNPNGLLPEVYHGTKEEIDVFMQTVPSKITPAQYDQLRDHAERIAKHKGRYPGQGDRLLHDIIGCALKSTESLSVQRSISGEGIMTPDAGAPLPWQPVPLHWPGDIFDIDARTSRREDIHTCLMARLNAFGIPVQIFLTGPHVTPNGDPRDKGFRHKEAVWLATIEAPNPSGVVPNIHLDVWPLQPLDSCNTADADVAAAALKTRICGTFAGAPKCDLTPHSYADLERHCEKAKMDDGIWSCCDPSAHPCTHRPAITTHLGDCGWTKLYGSTCPLAGSMDLSNCSDPSAP